LLDPAKPVYDRRSVCQQ